MTDYGIKLSHQSLWNIFKVAKVKPRKPDFKFTRKLKDPKLLELEKVQFANKVISRLRSGK